MTDTAAVLATNDGVLSAPITFQVKDKIYELPILQLTQWGEFCEWVAYLPYHRAVRQGIHGFELRSVIKECSEIFFTVNAPEVKQQILSSESGAIKVINLALKLANPKITEEELNNIINSEEWIPHYERYLIKNGFQWAKISEENEGDDPNDNPLSRPIEQK